uniref:DEP domain-containing protein n=1 Tax=Angiostrongylus cantonensis TaxID=6313 RepID=A0A0K0DLA0_ANGCA
MITRRRRSSCNGFLSGDPTCAPPKPPRGCLRGEPVKIEPLRTMDNVRSSCAFTAAKKYLKMKDYFRHAVQKREDGVFSGFDAVNILEEYLQANREQFTSTITKENTLKVLEMWLRENVIRPINSPVRNSPPLFSDSKKVMYTMNPEQDHKLYICATPLNSIKQDDRKPSRSNSFKRFFSPSRAKNADENTSLCSVSTSRSSSKVSDYTQATQQPSRLSSILNLPSRIFNTENRSIDEEAELHGAALFRLLTIVDIPMLDELIAVPGQPTRTASIVSTILSKIGLGGVTAETIASRDEEMDDLLVNTPSIRPILPWFQLARICAPTLYFQSNGNPNRMEIHNWAKSALQAVSERYALITHRGSSPLIPTEFSPILDAIVSQLLGKNQKKTKLALQYLFLMIPQQLRCHLSNVLQLLEQTTGTDVFVSLRNPYYLGKKGDNENFEVALNELRCFIVPQTIEKCEQNRIIELLIELRKEGSLGKLPDELHTDLRTLRANEGKEALPVRFCAAESAVKNFDADAEVAHTLTAIIDDSQMSLAEKQRKCELFKQHHPRIYRKYFDHLSW